MIYCDAPDSLLYTVYTVTKTPQSLILPGWSEADFEAYGSYHEISRPYVAELIVFVPEGAGQFDTL
ncbi:uncharacterized protein N7515_002760 [Penicillium bovifimosum]|uniref:Uncharacterized protein n=1 Tax=Penicillium bovifimosum TaxID=126998 RepID=A0A9W9L9K4_9EURO|nr:uncharacterized protein N7515_002760 [Penicillium bovifimosum]KAJ5143973.1 hypothetical protein N7515_002760 [Penicillium bovifimosum]